MQFEVHSFIKGYILEKPDIFSGVFLYWIQCPEFLVVDFGTLGLVSSSGLSADEMALGHCRFEVAV